MDISSPTMQILSVEDLILLGSKPEDHANSKDGGSGNEMQTQGRLSLKRSPGQSLSLPLPYKIHPNGFRAEEVPGICLQVVTGEKRFVLTP